MEKNRRPLSEYTQTQIGAAWKATIEDLKKEVRMTTVKIKKLTGLRSITNIAAGRQYITEADLDVIEAAVPDFKRRYLAELEKMGAASQSVMDMEELVAKCEERVLKQVNERMEQKLAELQKALAKK